MNKRMLINDLISVMVPHHTAEDKFREGRLGGTTCGFPPCLVLSEGGKGIKASEPDCYLHLGVELSQIKEKEVVKVVEGDCVPP